MSAFDGDSFLASSFSVDAFDILVAGTAIENVTAIASTGNTYEICDISGFKAKPGQLKKTWQGLYVLPRFWEPRNMQDFVKSKTTRQHGASRPEPIGNETFIDPDDPVTADDL